MPGNENGVNLVLFVCIQEERSKVDELRGTPMSVGNLEEVINENHAIVSTSVGSEHYVSILSFVDKDLLEPGCSVLLNHKVLCFGLLELYHFYIQSFHYKFIFGNAIIELYFCIILLGFVLNPVFDNYFNKPTFSI